MGLILRNFRLLVTINRQNPVKLLKINPINGINRLIFSRLID